jgi:starch phosphorylase
VQLVIAGKARWLGGLEDLQQALTAVSDEDFWSLRAAGRTQLVHFARQRLAQQQAEAGVATPQGTGIEDALDPNVMTLCFARRFTEYKRPNLLLQDPPRLARLLQDEHRPVQLVIAGKAHPRDQSGKDMIHAWTAFIREFDLHERVVFLSDYDMLMAEQLVQGADVWLNTPRRPWEASGTSGMKVLVNGGLNLSELDGWWSEAWRPEVGWAIGDRKEHGVDPAWDGTEADMLYNLLENEVVPCFYDRDQQGLPRSWLARVRASIAELAPRFSANRMLREYVETYYAPLARSYRRRAAEGARLAKSIEDRQAKLAAHWRMVRFGDLDVAQEGQGYRFRVPVYLDDLDPSDVCVELYAEPRGGQAAGALAMARAEPLTGAVNGFVYTATIDAKRPVGDYTPRVVPVYPEVAIPLETSHILWLR